MENLYFSELLIESALPPNEDLLLPLHQKTMSDLSMVLRFLFESSPGFQRVAHQSSRIRASKVLYSCILVQQDVSDLVKADSGL